MKKRALGLVAVLTALALMAGLAPGVSLADGHGHGRGGMEFEDVAEYPWALSAIESLSAQGVLQGTGPATFAPSGLTTRAEMATVLGRLLGWQATTTQLGLMAGFKDAGQIPGWARAWVAVAARNGILQGFPGGKFAPQGKITWAQLAVIVARAFNYPAVPADQIQPLLSQLPFGMLTPMWAAEAVAQNVQQGNFQGILAYLYQPNRPVTRAELALFLATVAQNAGQGSTATPPATQGSQVTGTVTAVTSSSLGLRLPDGTAITLPLAADVTVTAGGQAGTLQDVTVGAQVTVTIDSTAHVISISVQTPSLPAPVSTVTGYAVGWNAASVSLTVYTPGASSGSGLATYALLPGASVQLNGQTLGQAQMTSLLGESVTLGLDSQGRVVAVSGSTPPSPVSVLSGNLVGPATGGTTTLYQNGTFTSVDLGSHPLAFRDGQMVDPATVQAGTAVTVDLKALADGSALVIVQP
ncbi:MAG: S-layer homology domain-containing protein [Clostridia bacterium]|nr:S-layer homology domain-containing protein [Clostridia bacterium]